MADLIRPAVLRCLGIDPGQKKHGFAIIEVDRRGLAVFVHCGHESGSPVSLIRDAGRLDLVAVEEPATVHAAGATPTIVDVARAAGEFLGAAEAMGLRTATMMPARWRNLVTGSPRAGDADVKRMILARIPTWPKISNDHGRDAAGVALACALTWPTSLRVTP